MRFINFAKMKEPWTWEIWFPTVKKSHRSKQNSAETSNQVCQGLGSSGKNIKETRWQFVWKDPSFRGEYSQLLIHKLRAFLDYSNHKQFFLFKAFASITSAPPLEKSWLRPWWLVYFEFFGADAIYFHDNFMMSCYELQNSQKLLRLWHRHQCSLSHGRAATHLQQQVPIALLQLYNASFRVLFPRSLHLPPSDVSKLVSIWTTQAAQAGAAVMGDALSGVQKIISHETPCGIYVVSFITWTSTWFIEKIFRPSRGSSDEQNN